MSCHKQPGQDATCCCRLLCPFYHETQACHTCGCVLQAEHVRHAKQCSSEGGKPWYECDQLTMQTNKRASRLRQAPGQSVASCLWLLCICKHCKICQHSSASIPCHTKVHSAICRRNCTAHYYQPPGQMKCSGEHLRASMLANPSAHIDRWQWRLLAQRSYRHKYRPLLCLPAATLLHVFSWCTLHVD